MVCCKEKHIRDSGRISYRNFNIHQLCLSFCSLYLTCMPRITTSSYTMLIQNFIQYVVFSVNNNGEENYNRGDGGTKPQV